MSRSLVHLARLGGGNIKLFCAHTSAMALYMMVILANSTGHSYSNVILVLMQEELEPMISPRSFLQLDLERSRKLLRTLALRRRMSRFRMPRDGPISQKELSIRRMLKRLQEKRMILFGQNSRGEKKSRKILRSKGKL